MSEPVERRKQDVIILALPLAQPRFEGDDRHLMQAFFLLQQYAADVTFAQFKESERLTMLEGQILKAVDPEPVVLAELVDAETPVKS